MAAPENESDALAAVAQIAAATAKLKSDQAAAVLKAKYDAIENKGQETVDNTGTAAAAGAAAGGITTAGKGGKLVNKKYKEIVNEIEETVDNIGKAAKAFKNLGGLLSAGKGAGQSSNGARKHDHQGGFRFEVEVGGIKAGAFRSVDGLSATVELIEYQGGGDPYARQIPGRPKVAPVVLKKGYVNTAVLWDWMKATMEGDFKSENVSVILFDDSGQEELARYNLTESWPSRWAGWQLDANGSNAMVEEMELQVRTMIRVPK